jgi:hypothetical protein
MLTTMVSKMEKQNSRAFGLAPQIRDYFDMITTGEEGEFLEEVVPLKAKYGPTVEHVAPVSRMTDINDRTRATAPGYEEVNDNLKIKDAKGNFVLCYACGQSSMNKREIIQCDHCQLRWHLDCLDPPMSNPPIKDKYGRYRDGWMCPAHMEKDLVRTAGGREFKIRRPKKPRFYDPSFGRGVKNNGIIEIVNEPSDSEDEDGDSIPGKVPRLTERSICLDFIDRVKRYATPAHPCISLSNRML